MADSRQQLWILLVIVLARIALKLILFLDFYSNINQILQTESATYIAPVKSLLMKRSYDGMFERTPSYPTFLEILFYFLAIIFQ